MSVKYQLRRCLDVSGMTIIEVLLSVAIMGVISAAFTSMIFDQQKNTNFVFFQMQRTQLKASIMGQVLNNSENCKCIFSGAGVFPASPPSPGAKLNVTARSIGRVEGIVSGNCAASSIPNPFVNDSAAGIDGIRTNGITLENIKNVGGNYGGDLIVDLQSVRPVLGPSKLKLSIPVAVMTSPSGTNRQFEGCSLMGSTSGGFRSLNNVALANFPVNGTLSYDFLNAIPAVDRPNVVAIQIAIENQNMVVTPGNQGARIQFVIDGSTHFLFFSDTDAQDEHFLISQQSFVAPGARTITMSATNCCVSTPPRFQIRVTGYLMR